ncbi:MAG: ATP synthase F1 subunit delta [Alphaproteobacteria bacterium]|nr:ATP synthase F1 subunit delta [Alphaproteobacteria bacterium]
MASSHSDALTIAERYTTALFALAEEAKALQPVADDLNKLAQLIKESPEFSRLTENPYITSASRLQAAEIVGEKLKAHDLTKRFLRQLAEAGRFAALPLIITRFIDRVAAGRGEVIAEIISATPLRSNQQSLIVKALQAKFGQKLMVRETVEPNILGGLMVRIGSTMLDASVRSRLDKLSQSLRASARQLA